MERASRGSNCGHATPPMPISWSSHLHDIVAKPDPLARVLAKTGRSCGGGAVPVPATVVLSNTWGRRSLANLGTTLLFSLLPEWTLYDCRHCLLHG